MNKLLPLNVELFCDYIMLVGDHMHKKLEIDEEGCCELDNYSEIRNIVNSAVEFAKKDTELDAEFFVIHDEFLCYVLHHDCNFEEAVNKIICGYLHRTLFDRTFNVESEPMNIQVREPK